MVTKARTKAAKTSNKKAKPGPAKGKGKAQQDADPLYLHAEPRAEEFSLFPEPGKGESIHIKGLMTAQSIRQTAEQLSAMEIDGYIEAAIQPVEDQARPGAREIIQALGINILDTIEEGPLYIVTAEMDFSGETRKLAFITQDRSQHNGIWMPQHHKIAADAAHEFAIQSIPIVTFLDTPGASGSSEANAGNQAHSISHLIAEMCNLDVPTVGIIVGQAYSGGAIPLAATNVVLALRTATFSTIRPQGLASIARRYNFTWQECARFVGVATAELYQQGNIDGIVDYDPGETETLQNLYDAITSSILSVEKKASDFVRDEPDVLNHYERNISRYLNPGSTYLAVHAGSPLKLRTSPTQWPSIFGVTYRYMRYLGLRKRIRSTSTSQYGRLSDQAVPEGQMSVRIELDRRSRFLNWLQDPDRILYDDELNKRWKQFAARRTSLQAGEPSRISQLLFGEPERNFEEAREALAHASAMHIFNRFKGDVANYLGMLMQHLHNLDDTRFLLHPSEISDVQGLLTTIARADTDFIVLLRQHLSYQGKKLLDPAYVAQHSPDAIKRQLVTQLNLLLEGPPLGDGAEQFLISNASREVAAEASDKKGIQLNRHLLADHLWSYIRRYPDADPELSDTDRTLLDVVLDPDMQEEFIAACRSLLVFDALYRDLIRQLVVVAKKADETKSLDEEFIGELIDSAVTSMLPESDRPKAEKPPKKAKKPKSKKTESEDAESAEAAQTEEAEEEKEAEPLTPHAELKNRFLAFMMRLTSNHHEADRFLKSVEDWQRALRPDLSDTLFVVVSFVFERLIPQYNEAKQGRTYDGSLLLRRIGRRKDFWNRLTIAYQDLLIQEALTKEKHRGQTSVQNLVSEFFTDFEELNSELMTSDPMQFPSLRNSVEEAIRKDVTPCGVITGTGRTKTPTEHRVGVILSNVDFQAGCIDMASCEKICRLLVHCAAERLPVVGFISSGGMQTKEGASVLFSMAVLNDRITRFIRDNDLPVIMIGFGDCTGGSQASFVTHPLVQSYYFSGTNMPFAGQAVVESHLTSRAILSNYLSATPGAMQGLVQHPFSTELDDDLRRIDPTIPLPTESVTDMIERVMKGVLDPEPLHKEAHKPDERELLRPIKRVLIHARGCTAVKLIRSAHALKLQVVLVQSDPDMDSVPADMVNASKRDKVVCIGGNTSDESYLNALSVLHVGETESVDSLHPGIGFLSEDPNFARLCRDREINFIGPWVSSMETMGNKSNAINTTRAIDVPVVPGSHGILNTPEAAAEAAEQTGFPVLLKAVHGGGGKGIEVVETADQVHGQFMHVTAEAKAAFGNGDVYLEKYITSLRHVEVQVLCDAHGNICILGLRDCSVQRSNQKLMEESDSTVLPEKLRKQAFKYAHKIAEAVDYTGAGTVEFIYDRNNDAIYFMEMNTRLQVEHPVTEKVTGIDIVAAQFAIASGKSIEDMQPEENGYAIEVRINAEKTVVDAEGHIAFAPSPGLITECTLPERRNIDVISMAAEGKSVTPFYDSLIVQVIAKGETREKVITALLTWLNAAVIKGVSTNIPLLKRILKDSVFKSGDYDTGYLSDFLERIDVNKMIAEAEEAAGSTKTGLTADSVKIQGSGELRVLAPSTGVFYATPSPSEPPYVSLGDEISTGDTLCQIEAMKIFTPVSLASFVDDHSEEIYASNRTYRVNRVNLTSGQQVNEGDLLFVIEPVEQQFPEEAAKEKSD